MSKVSSQSDSSEYESGKGKVKHYRRRTLSGEKILTGKEAERELERIKDQRRRSSSKDKDENRRDSRRRGTGSFEKFKKTSSVDKDPDRANDNISDLPGSAKDLERQLSEDKKERDHHRHHHRHSHRRHTHDSGAPNESGGGRRKSSQDRDRDRDRDRKQSHSKDDKKGKAKVVHHHHHREYHHRHYKKLLFPWPFGSPPEKPKPEQKDAVTCPVETASPPRVRLADNTTSVSRTFQQTRKGSMGGEDAVDDDELAGRGIELRRREGSEGSDVLFNPDGSITDAGFVKGNDCPFCGQGKFKLKFTWTGIIGAFLCFPCGIYCCFMCRVMVCSYCGVTPI